MLNMIKTTKKVLFIHHSTGANLIKEGKIRELLDQKIPNIKLWDHGYNLYPSLSLSKLLANITYRTGLSDSQGRLIGIDYDIFISNNSPKEYAEIFSSNLFNNTLKKILRYDVIIFKNCFPTTKIKTKEKLKQHIMYYNEIRDSINKYTNKKFIVFTPPPLRRELTQPQWAKRARKLANYMTSDKYIKQNDNLKVFNFFDLLADKNGDNKNMLKREYCRFFWLDSHPNKKANKDIGKIFLEFLKLNV